MTSWNQDCCIWKELKSLFRRRQWQPTPVFLPGKSHGRRSLVGCSPWGREESDTTERLHFLFSLSCFGEGNGNPFQCSCLENPRDGGAGWEAVYGVVQSWTWLKRLSSSSSNCADASCCSVSWLKFFPICGHSWNSTLLHLSPLLPSVVEQSLWIFLPVQSRCSISYSIPLFSLSHQNIEYLVEN